MQHAAIYVREPVAANGIIISNEEQKSACRDYWLSKGLSVSATFRDTGGSRGEFARMIDQATESDTPFDAIVVWKLNRFSISLVLRQPWNQKGKGGEVWFGRLGS